MTKTGRQVQEDVYRMLKGGGLAAFIRGDVYLQGMRPRDSRGEDAVVAFNTGLPGDIQTGAVTVRIYVPDIDPYGNGTLVEDVSRTLEIEAAAQEWADSLTTSQSNYLFSLRRTVTTEEEPDITQHYVAVSLKYRYYE